MTRNVHLLEEVVKEVFTDKKDRREEDEEETRSSSFSLCFFGFVAVLGVISAPNFLARAYTIHSFRGQKKRRLEMSGNCLRLLCFEIFLNRRREQEGGGGGRER
jgi:hypothetical protein